MTIGREAGRSVLCPQCGNLVGVFNDAGGFESRRGGRNITIDPPVAATICCEECHSCWRLTSPTAARIATPTYRR